MKIKHIVPAALLSLLSLGACTDDFGEVNTNPNKVYNVELEHVFSGTVKRTMDIVAELNYKYYLNASRYAVVRFVGIPVEELDERQMRTFYVNILTDLTLLERRYEQNKELYANRLAIVKTWKSYCYYVLVSTYGPVPMSDAISDGQGNKREYRYDSEKDVYTAILKDLKEAGELFNSSTSQSNDRLDLDPVFSTDENSSNLDKWVKFANTLRLNVALQVQNIDKSLSEEHAREAMLKPLIDSNADNVVLKYGTMATNTESYYYKQAIYNKPTFQNAMYPALGEYFFTYMRTLSDPRLDAFVYPSNGLKFNGTTAPSGQQFVYNDTITRPHLCYNRDNTSQGYKKCPYYAEHSKDPDLTARLRDSISIDVTMPYVPYPEHPAVPGGWQVQFKPGTVNPYLDPLNTKSDFNISYVRDNFVSESAEMVLLTYADACFLRAEAEVVFNHNLSAAKSAYEEGIEASMSQYKVSAGDYLSHPGVAWGTDVKGYHDRRQLWQAKISGSNGEEGALEQIYKQRYIADFFNGIEGWNLERRTRVNNYPPFFRQDASTAVIGTNPTYNYCNERMNYPNSEMSRNAAAYTEAVAMLQSASPYARPERGGDNVFTCLAFAKPVPDIANADSRWLNRQMIYFADYYQNWWGQTYEELLAKAFEYTGTAPSTSASVINKTLGQIAYKYSATVSIYDPAGEWVPEEK